MTNPEGIGGYFGLELSRGSFPHSDALLLNSGRSCFEYVLRSRRPRRVLLPRYTCSAMHETAARVDVPVVQYAIDDRLEIASGIVPEPDELLVYTNYFGLKDDYCRRLHERIGDRLLLDCSQAFFFEPPRAADAFFSPRKFFGVPDGGCLYSGARIEGHLATDVSFRRVTHLVRRIDEGPEAGHPDFRSAEADLGRLPMMAMSRLTRALLCSIDFEESRRRRSSNAQHLHDALGRTNRLELDLPPSCAPLCYPYLPTGPCLRRRLAEHRIFVPTYWPDLPPGAGAGAIESDLASLMLPLPIDQRYGRNDMELILKALHARI